MYHFRSGTDEQYDKRDALLLEVQELIDEQKTQLVKNEDAKMQEKVKEEQGKKVRDMAMKNLKEKDDNEPSDG